MGLSGNSMKSLYLLRHAKTEAGGFFTQDKDRKLTDRGCSDAMLLARHMKDKGLLPDQVLCSSAVRAQMTCDLIVEGLEREIEVDFEDDELLDLTTRFGSLRKLKCGAPRTIAIRALPFDDDVLLVDAKDRATGVVTR